MLGAVIDLSGSSRGTILVKNKESRINDIRSLVESVCEADSVTASTLETLKGRLLYAAGHTFGRCTQLALQLIARVTHRGPLILLDNRAKLALRDAFSCLAESGPRSVQAWSGRRPLVIFTDGACEENGELVTHGAVLFDPESSSSYMFGDKVPIEWLDQWRREGKRQMICQAEIFPILVAKMTWGSIVKGQGILTCARELRLAQAERQIGCAVAMPQLVLPCSIKVQYQRRCVTSSICSP